MCRKSRNRDGPDLLKREVKYDELSHVGKLHHDAVEWLEAYLQQIQRQIISEAIDIGVSKRTILIDKRDSVRVAFENGLEFLRERLIDPIAAFAIALRILGRK